MSGVSKKQQSSPQCFGGTEGGRKLDRVGRMPIACALCDWAPTAKFVGATNLVARLLDAGPLAGDLISRPYNYLFDWRIILRIDYRRRRKRGKS